MTPRWRDRPPTLRQRLAGALRVLADRGDDTARLNYLAELIRARQAADVEDPRRARTDEAP